MQRFERRYFARQAVPCGALKKWASIVAGIAVILVGVVLLPLPGPGMLVILFGAALMAGHSRAVARLLDRGERWLRSRWAAWRSSRAPARER